MPIKPYAHAPDNFHRLGFYAELQVIFPLRRTCAGSRIAKGKVPLPGGGELIAVYEQDGITLIQIATKTH